MNDLPAADRSVVQAFLARNFPGLDIEGSAPISAEEGALIGDVIAYVDQRFRRMKYPPGLALDFTLLAQRLSVVDTGAKVARPDLTADAIFDRYQRVMERGDMLANTLTLTFQGTEEGIRSIEEDVRRLFYELDRPGYPSSYVYATGQWQKFTDLLVMCFRLSEPARLEAVRQLIDYGLVNLPANTFIGRPTARVRLFEEIIKNYPRRPPRGIRENAGLTFQALAYGFIFADRGHLDVIASGVRTGSARQRRIGDIDGYYGLDVELSVEVKDRVINSTNAACELSGFANNIKRYGIFGIALVQDITDDVRWELAEKGVVALTQQELLDTVQTWDWRKQDAAVHAMLHYLAHVEQNVDSVKRLLAFIHGLDSTHESLVYFQP